MAVDVVGRQERKHLCFLWHMFSLATFLGFSWMESVTSGAFWSFPYLPLPGSSTGELSVSQGDERYTDLDRTAWQDVRPEEKRRGLEKAS